jgi:hypothetical protein
MDNDGDGTTDYPLDLTCTSASGTDESCRSSEGILLPTTNVLTGTTVGRTDDYHPTCSSTASNTGDLTYQLDLPALNTFNLAFTRGDTGYDEVIALLPSTCTTPEVRCTDFPPMALTNVAAGRYFLVVDGYGAGDEGAFTATITGTIAPGGSCESPLATSGGLTCSAGYACSGTMGARTCNLTACNDNTDADGDGKVGFPTDPGCTSTSDNDETDNCPSGPGCPACANALDDDADGATDYPLDAGCASASGTSEVTCPAETDPVIVINGPAFTGTTVGKAHNLTPSCGTSGTSPEVTYELNLTVPVLLLTVDTENSTLDTVMSVRNASCGSPDIDCDDDSGVSSGSSFLELVDVLPGGYTITVDGYSSTSASGAYNLNVKGEVAAGTACTGPLFVQNVLTCTSGTTCTAGTCQ